MLNFDPNHTVSTRTICEVIQASQHLKCDQKSLLKAVGIDSKQLKNSENRFTVESLFSVYQYVSTVSNEPDIGLYVGKISYNNSLGLQQYLSSTCETIRDYLNLIPSVVVQSGDIGRLRVSTTESEGGDKYLSIEWLPSSKETRSHRYFSDAVLSSFITSLNAISLRPIPVIQADFSYSRPDDDSMLAQWFTSNMRFNQKNSRLLIPYESINYGICRQAFSLSKAVHLEVKHMFEAGEGDDFIRKLGISIQRLLSSGLSIHSVASDLNISTRTLQRRLEDRDTYFVRVVQNIRCKLSKRYIADQILSLSEISFLLGYSSQSAFTSAFKSWNDCTPKEYLQNTLT